MPNPDEIRIISPIAFFALLGIGMRNIALLPLAYFILVYCKLSSYYPFLGAMRAELVFAVVILLRLSFSGNIKNIDLKENKVHKFPNYFLRVCRILLFDILGYAILVGYGCLSLNQGFDTICNDFAINR